MNKTQDLLNDAKEAARDAYKASDGWIDADAYFVRYDDPARTSYKVYDSRPQSTADSIWLVDGKAAAIPLENDEKSSIVQAFKQKRYFDRIIVPKEIRDKLQTSS